LKQEWTNMQLKRLFGLLPRSLVAAALFALAACGGGSGIGDASSLGGIIGGTGLKGPVGGATVTAYAVSGGAIGAPIGTAMTDTSGSFSIPIGGYAGPVMLQLAGGSYVDEATGLTMPMASGDLMTAVLPAVAAGSTVSGIRITPLTAMAQSMAQNTAGGMTDANVMAANAAIGSYFLVGDILHTQPMNPLVTDSVNGASQDAINYGMALAAMSQYAKGLGMSSSSAFVTAMMSDASDGTMDGMMGHNQIMMGGMGMGMSRGMPRNAGTSGLGAAMSAFVASQQNRSGVPAAAVQPLITRLNASNGQLCGACRG
jgi:hypothetical protein